MSRTSTTAWKRIVRTIREQGRRANTPCHLCHGRLGPIDYRTQGEADTEARTQGHYWEIGQPRPLALDVDHLTPHSAGGQDTLLNAAPSHAVCNRKAGAKQTPRKATNKPVAGYWWPNNGRGDPLRGHAKPGAQTRTHTFKQA